MAAVSIVKMRVTGVSPLLMNNPANMRRQENGEALVRGGKKIPKPEDEAKAGLYVLPSHQLYASADWFREAGLIAAVDVRDPSRKGRASMARRFGASVFLSRAEFPLFKAGKNGKHGSALTDGAKDWEVFLKRVVIQNNGVMKARPLVREWECEVEFEYDKETIEPNLIIAIMNQAGKYPGVGDYRPGKKGPYGRFQAEAVA